MVQSLKKKGEVKENRMVERGRAASQWISHSRPGLSAGGCARGEITGLLPRSSIHRHTANDRKLLAPGRLTDSPRHCLQTAIFSFNHLPPTEINLHGEQTTAAQSLYGFQTARRVIVHIFCQVVFNWATSAGGQRLDETACSSLLSFGCMSQCPAESSRVYKATVVPNGMR